MDKNQEKRIKIVFHNKTEDCLKRMETIGIYKEYLVHQLSYPLELTGIEDFNWEEFYVFGPGNPKEYEKLKKTNPSFTDSFNLIKIDELYDEYYGLIAIVKRNSDNKKFKIPLADLKATNKRLKNYKLLDDYSVWFINY